MEGGLKAEGAGGEAELACTETAFAAEEVGEKEGRVLETEFREVFSVNRELAGPMAHSDEQGGPWTKEDWSSPTGEVVQSLRRGLTAEGFTIWSFVVNGRWPRLGKLLLETCRSVFLKAEKNSRQKAVQYRRGCGEENFESFSSPDSTTTQ